MSTKEQQRVSKTIKELTVEMNRLHDQYEAERDEQTRQRIHHDTSQMFVIIQSLMAL